MFFSQARIGGKCVQRALLACVLSAGIAGCQSTPPPVNPTQPAASPKPPLETQPGKVDHSQDAPVQTVGPTDPSENAQAGTDSSQAPAPPIVFESHGLEYEAITKNGITVMFAQLPSRLKEFNIVQVTVTNGSLVSWTVRPGDFSFVKQGGVALNAVSADYVVAELLQHANRDDVIKLQLLYENSIYGLSNFRSTNGHEKRREAAMAQFVNRGFKAAAEASSIAFVPIKLRTGDSTDGAIFFENRTEEKNLGAGRFVARTCGETFMFETYAELKKR